MTMGSRSLKESRIGYPLHRNRVKNENLAMKGTREIIRPTRARLASKVK